MRDNQNMTIFFDIDDTLYDRSQPFRAAAKEFFQAAVPDLNDAYRKCCARGDEVFHASQRGEISMDEMYIYRWGRGFADAGISIAPGEALEFQRLYRRNQDYITLSPVIEEMLRYCSGKTDIGIITNGPSEKQWNKIFRLGLERFVTREMMIVSADVGVDKPDPVIFRIAEKRSGADPGELLYVGDSLDNDIFSAEECGWHTLWYNRKGLQTPEGIHPVGIVRNEEELAEEVKRIGFRC